MNAENENRDLLNSMLDRLEKLEMPDDEIERTKDLIKVRNTLKNGKKFFFGGWGP